MSRLRTILFVLALTLIVLLLIGCGASSEEPTAASTATAAPTATLEPTATATAAPTATLEPTASANSASGDAPETTPSGEIPEISTEVPRMPVDELKERLDDGQEIVIVDTRGQASYDLKHIPGAIRMPSSSIDSPLDELPLDHLIVLYCA